MGSKNLLLVAVLAVVLCFSCKTDPNKTESEAPVENQPAMIIKQNLLALILQESARRNTLPLEMRFAAL